MWHRYDRTRCKPGFKVGDECSCTRKAKVVIVETDWRSTRGPVRPMVVGGVPR